MSQERRPNAELWLGQPSCDSWNPRFIGVLGNPPQLELSSGASYLTSRPSQDSPSHRRESAVGY
jgi:hypothetical protein